MSYPSCPRCGVEVGSTWRWCLACGYDPDGAAQQIRARAIEARRRKGNWIPSVVVVVGLALGGTFLWKTTPSNGSSRVTTPPSVPLDQIGWQPFTPPTGGFTVDLPGPPTHSTGTFSPTGGATESWISSVNGRIISVVSLDTGRPELDAGVSSDAAQTVMRRTVDQVAGVSGGTVGEAVPTAVGPSDALDYTVEGAPVGRTRGRVVFGGRTLFLVSVTSTEPDDAIEDRVIGSFRFA